MLALYRCLLRLYPAGYFREYGGEMAAVFRQAQEAARHLSVRARALFCLREISGVLAGALHEHFRYVHGNPLRRLDMRSFRFPRSAIVLMSVILGMVVVTIEKAQNIHSSTPVGFAIWHRVPRAIAFGILPFFILAAIAYAILFALRQTGVQRLSNVQTWTEKK
jgi:hypothetical protein